MWLVMSLCLVVFRLNVLVSFWLHFIAKSIIFKYEEVCQEKGIDWDFQTNELRLLLGRGNAVYLHHLSNQPGTGCFQMLSKYSLNESDFKQTTLGSQVLSKQQKRQD